MNDGTRGTSIKGVVAYLVLTFGLAWGSWALLLPASATDLRLFELCALPGAFAPAIASFVVRKWITREGFGDAGLGLHLRYWRFYLVGWLLPFAVVAFIVLAAVAFGLGKPDFSMLAALARIAPHAKIPPSLAGVMGYLIPLQLLIGALIATPLLFGEEFGWRGYLQVRLFARWPTLAAIATGVIWGLWHLPLILRGYEFPGDPVVVTAVFCTSTVLLSIVFGWLRRKSGSVWVTSLAHSATNAIGGSLTLLLFPDRTNVLFLGYLGILSWIPLGLLCLWIVGRGSGARSERSQE
jgi:membrane protease YdiL (CAAX protease family)